MNYAPQLVQWDVSSSVNKAVHRLIDSPAKEMYVSCIELWTFYFLVFHLIFEFITKNLDLTFVVIFFLLYFYQIQDIITFFLQKSNHAMVIRVNPDI